MISATLPRSVRAQLALETRDIHEALHQDAVLSCLIDPRITRAKYRAALEVFLAIHSAVEARRARMEVFPRLSLAGVCEALQADIGSVPAFLPAVELETREEVLGALYVLHGSGFGRNVFRKSVQKALPSASCNFLKLQGHPDVWRHLCDTLESVGHLPQNFQRVRRGAQDTFQATCLISSQAAERLGSRVV